MIAAVTRNQFDTVFILGSSHSLAPSLRPGVAPLCSAYLLVSRTTIARQKHSSGNTSRNINAKGRSPFGSIRKVGSCLGRSVCRSGIDARLPGTVHFCANNSISGFLRTSLPGPRSGFSPLCLLPHLHDLILPLVLNLCQNLPRHRNYHIQSGLGHCRLNILCLRRLDHVYLHLHLEYLRRSVQK